MYEQLDRSKNKKNKSKVSSVIQSKNNETQGFKFVDNRPNAVMQQKRQEIGNASFMQQQTIQKKENNTGLSDDLKSGIENLSGYSMDDVKVHYNSSKPVQLNAHAYAQGSDIHLGSGQEKHLPHEAWHVVQQKQGRVKPTLQKKGIVVNDDAGLEREADLMGDKASNFVETGPAFQKLQSASSHTEQLNRQFTDNSYTTPVIQAYINEDMLIARLRGLDTVIRVHQNTPSEFVLEEIQELTREIEDKNWLKATAVLLALRDKYGIDQFPPPLEPMDAPEIIGGDYILESANAVPLPRGPDVFGGPTAVPLLFDPDILGVPTAGANRIELGSGNMASAAALWHTQDDTAFTEFRSKEELSRDYQEHFTDNLEQIGKQQSHKRRNNQLAYGIDATKEGRFENLPLTRHLRFTNPNIGHQDIAESIRSLVDQAIRENEEGPLYFTSMNLHFWLSMERLEMYRQSTSKTTWLDTVLTSTTNAISTCRNVFMLHKFLMNAPAKLIPGTGKIEIIVSTSYLKRWPILQMAQSMKYQCKVEQNYDLGFQNIRTQSDQLVSDKAPPEKCLITLYPPWGGALEMSSILAWIHQFTEYNQRQPSMLTSASD